MRKLKFFWAPWCNKCPKVKKLLIEKKIKDIEYINIEEYEGDKGELKFKSLPALVIMDDTGKKIADVLSGTIGELELEEFLARRR